MPSSTGGIFYSEGRPVSRVLSGDGSCKRRFLPVRHLSSPVIADAVIRPTPRLGRAALRRRYTWSFNPSGVRLPVSPQGPVSSYLTFSPLSRHVETCRDCYFLLHCYTLPDIFPLGRMVLCVARTFLSDTIVGTTDRPAGDKDIQLFRIRDRRHL